MNLSGIKPSTSFAPLGRKAHQLKEPIHGYHSSFFPWKIEAVAHNFRAIFMQGVTFRKCLGPIRTVGFYCSSEARSASREHYRTRIVAGLSSELTKKERICMRQLLHFAFAIVYTQCTIQPFYCQIGNNISLLLNFVYLGVLVA